MTHVNLAHLTFNKLNLVKYRMFTQVYMYIYVMHMQCETQMHIAIRMIFSFKRNMSHVQH